MDVDSGDSTAVVTLPEDHWAVERGLESFDGPKAQMLGRYKSFEDFVDGHMKLVDYRGRSVALPKDDASDEDKAKAMRAIGLKLGVPESPEGYELKKPDDLPEGLGWDDDVAKAFAQFCYDNNIPKAKAQEIVKFQTDANVKQLEARTEQDKATAAEQDKAAKEATAALRDEIGADKFDAFMAKADKAYDLADKDAPGLKDLFDSTGLKNNAAVVKLMHKMYSQQIEEDTAAAGAGGGLGGAAGALSDDFYDTTDDGRPAE